MTSRKWLLGFVALVVLSAAAVLLIPSAGPPEADQDAPFAPEFGSTVSIDNARLALPDEAGEYAQLHFDITNRGEQTAQIAEVAVEHAQQVGMVEVEGPAPMPLAKLSVGPGETMRFGPGERFLVVSDYDPNIVPGAVVEVTLVFGNAETISFPVTVTTAAGKTGFNRTT